MGAQLQDNIASHHYHHHQQQVVVVGTQLILPIHFSFDIKLPLLIK
jgi:hypothetical protein